MEREELAVLGNRLEFVEALEDEPLHKADLVEEFHHSRSTVDRAINELENVGFVERVSRGYVTTQTGQLVAKQYRQFLGSFDRQLDIADVVDAVPAEYELPHTLFDDSTVESIDGPHELFARVTDVIGAGETCRILLPKVFDSRHVQVWHSQVVRSDRTVELFTDELVLDQLEVECPDLTNELADTDGFEVYEIPMPAFGIVVPVSHGTRNQDQPVLVITYEDDGIAGVIETKSSDAHAWARDQFQEYRDECERVTDRLWSEDRAETIGIVSGAGLSPSLESEGFELVDEDFFDEREPIAPETGWRAGLGLAEVADGQSVDRELDDETLCEHVSEKLTDGTDIVVLGPAGAGKSTLCKQVACEWSRERDGHVIYRESGLGCPFSSTRMLEEHVREAEEHVLVVVEDAVRSEASDIVTVMNRLAGRDDISFLLDAREEEWHDSESPLDARMDAFRHSALDVVSVPALEENDVEKLMTTAESLMNATVEIEPPELLAEVREGNTGDSGAMLLLIHRLARLADPLDDNGGATALDDDVDRVRADLKSIGETALDVGLLANTLNAASIELHPELLYAVALPETDGSVAQVSDALDRLDGHVLLSRQGDPFCHGPHESWSVRFLERYAERAETERAKQRFEQCLQAVFSLADRPQRCDRLVGIVDGETPALDRIAADRRKWAEDIATGLFRLGTTNARVAPLFAPSEESTLSLPRVCSTETRAECLLQHGEMYAEAGDYEAASAEFRRLESLGSDASLPGYRGEALRRLGSLAGRQGDFEQADSYFQRSLAIVERTDEKKQEADCLNGLGLSAVKQRDLDRARGLQEQSLELYRELDDPHGEAKALHNLGVLERSEGNHDQAGKYYEQSLSLVRETGDRKGEAQTLHNLAEIAITQGQYDQSREYRKKSLDIFQEIGNPEGIMNSLNGLGSIAYHRSRYDEAREYYERSRDIAAEIGQKPLEATSLNNIGLIEYQRGEYEHARQYFERSLEIRRTLEQQSDEASTLNNLGSLARKRGAYDRTENHHEQALDITREIDDRHREAESLANLGTIARIRGEFERARDALTEALDIARDVGVLEPWVSSRRELGAVSRETGDHERAAEYLDEALDACTDDADQVQRVRIHLERARLELARDEPRSAQPVLDQAQDRLARITAPHDAARAAVIEGRIATATGSPGRAREHWQEALTTFEDVGAPQDVLGTLGLLVEVCRELGDDERVTQFLERGQRTLETAPEPVQRRDWFDRGPPEQ
ncbi:tetratricopeptide repeat protein [Halovenus rubra]|uniref:Tetratricopeptide repeat protein n=2 Tax=Halovenus rubra TaxID=869890 RepID=A0ACC7E054_9EURY|nr:tetratricopeptide repeat protein [Halovenus rubra]